MKKIFVTGVGGFIGFHTAKKLLDNMYDVVGLDNFNAYYDPKIKKDRNAILSNYGNYKLYTGDIADLELIKKIFAQNTFNKICHLAAQAGVRYSLINPFSYEESNLKGFLNILECAKQHNVKDFIYASSSSVYGKNKIPKTGFSEKDKVNKPMSLYGATKRANELMAYAYHHLFGMHCTGLRFFSVYGPWGRPDMALFKFADAIVQNKEVQLFNYGEMTRNFTYIDDITDGIVAAIEKAYPYEIFNLGNSKTVQLKVFLQCIEKELGKKAKIKLMPMQQGDIPDTLANISHAEKKLHFYPKTDVGEGIKKFISWYKEYFNAQFN